MTSDLRRPPADPLEADLQTLFGATPSRAVGQALDRRIDQAIHEWDPAAARRPRRRAGRRIALIGLIAAGLVVGAWNGNLQALYMVAAGPFDLPWHRGEAIGQSQVVDGYRVTIDRAYADATRLALGVSVVDEERRPGITQLDAMGSIVTDEDGEYGGMGATSNPDGPFAALVVAWKVPPVLPLPSGPRTFRVVFPAIQVRDDSIPPADPDAVGWSPWHDHAGPWTFEFQLDVDGGTAMTPDASATVDGVTVNVTRVITASNIVRVDVRIDGAPKDDGWAPIGSISHGDRTARFVKSSLEDDGTVALSTDGGVGDPGGSWTITFDELVGNDRLAGPWIIEFDGP